MRESKASASGDLVQPLIIEDNLLRTNLVRKALAFPVSFGTSDLKDVRKIGSKFENKRNI